MTKRSIFAHMALNNTKKLCCRKDDRAMRPVYGCRENLRGSLTAVSECRLSQKPTNVKNSGLRYAVASQPVTAC